MSLDVGGCFKNSSPPDPAFPLLEVSIIILSCCVWVCVVVVVCLWLSCAIFCLDSSYAILEECGFVFIKTVVTSILWD